MSNEYILITGGAGFIGQHLTRGLLKQGFNVRIIDNFNPQIHEGKNLPSDLSSQVDLINADIRDREAMKKALKGIDRIVHLAAETGTGQSMYEIEKYFSVNMQGTANLLQLAGQSIEKAYKKYCGSLKPSCLRRRSLSLF